jgi:hypothetical protein
MQQKYGPNGLAAVSVSLDDPHEKGIPEKVHKFLQKQHATFENFILSAKPEEWQKKLGIEGPPCLYVFNREGKIARKFDAGEKYDEVEKLVLELLKK